MQQYSCMLRCSGKSGADLFYVHTHRHTSCTQLADPTMQHSQPMQNMQPGMAASAKFLAADPTATISLVSADCRMVVKNCKRPICRAPTRQYGWSCACSASPAYRSQPPLSHQGSGLHFSFGIQLDRGARVTAQSAAARECFHDADQLPGAIPVAPKQANDFAAAQMGVKVHHQMHLDAASRQ